jgi:hypothetical protein
MIDIMLAADRAYNRAQSSHCKSHTVLSLRHVRPNVTAEWLAFLLLIWKVPFPILAPRPAILNYIFRGFPQSVHANAGILQSTEHEKIPALDGCSGVV